MSVHSILLASDLYTQEYLKQEDICRLCWSKNAHRYLYENTAENSSKAEKQLVFKIKCCLDIDLEKGDPLDVYPKKICETCFCKIDSFYDFKTFCRDTDRRLHEIFDSVPNLPVYVEYITPMDVKLDDVRNFTNLNISESDSLESFMDTLQQIETSLDDTPDQEKSEQKSKTSKYKLKRTSTYCNICCQDFKESDVLLKHNLEEHGIEQDGAFLCFGCGKRFSTRKSRVNHEIVFCKGLKDGYKCEVCNRFLPTRKMYEIHRRNHRDNKEIDLPDEIFKCTKCDEQFKTREDLRNHLKLHIKGKNYVCETCGRVFFRQDYLHKHILTHTGVKEHACPHCDYRTSQRTSIIVHIRKHTGERPYKCDLCPQRCVSSSNLAAHRRRHLVSAADQQQYQCEVCPKKFAYKVSLQEHIKTVHQRSQSQCPHCGAVYSRTRGLKRHLVAKHGAEKTRTTTRYKNVKVDQGVRNTDKIEENVEGVDPESIHTVLYPASNGPQIDQGVVQRENENKNIPHSKENQDQGESLLKFADGDICREEFATSVLVKEAERLEKEQYPVFVVQTVTR